jgi:excinuclease ABC subunit C
MDHEKLKKSIARLPKGPGVYIFRDARKKPLYIGKAANLRSRVSAYPKSIDVRIQKMIETARSLDHQKTGSDIEALILESQLIKQHRPQFNIMLRDDKQYFFVVITHEEFPRIYVGHQQRDPYAEYIGPFTEGTALRSTLKALRNIFPYCTCKQKHHVRCLNAHIGKCISDCCLRNPDPDAPKAYRKNIKAISDILQGRRTSVMKLLEKEMKSHAAEEQFEKSAELKTKIERIRRVFENVSVLQDLSSRRAQSAVAGVAQLQVVLKSDREFSRIEGYDISNIQGEHATGAMVVFHHGIADKNSYRKFKIKTVFDSDDTGMLQEVLHRRFNHPEWKYPDLIIMDGGKGQVNTALKVLNESKLSIPVIGLTKDKRHVGDHIFIGTANKGLLRQPIPLSKLPETVRNLILAVDAEAHRFAIHYYRSLHKRSLKG